MVEMNPPQEELPPATSPAQEKWVYGYTPTSDGVEFHPVRQLSEGEYDAAGNAVKVLLDVLTGPTAFAELARRDMTTTIEDVRARLATDFRDIQRWGPELEYRIVAVSAALRMHEEFVMSTIGKRSDDEARTGAKVIFRGTYDRSQAYRIIYSLRNALVHGSKGLTSLSAKGTLNQDGTISTTISINLSRKRFGASDVKAPVRAELRAMQEDPDLFLLANLALDDLAAMREQLEPLLYPDAPAAARLIFAYVQEVFAAGFGSPHFHAHDTGDIFGNLSHIPMNEAVFNHAVRSATTG